MTFCKHVCWVHNDSLKSEFSVLLRCTSWPLSRWLATITCVAASGCIGLVSELRLHPVYPRHYIPTIHTCTCHVHGWLHIHHATHNQHCGAAPNSQSYNWCSSAKSKVHYQPTTTTNDRKTQWHSMHLPCCMQCMVIKPRPQDGKANNRCLPAG